MKDRLFIKKILYGHHQIQNSPLHLTAFLDTGTYGCKRLSHPYMFTGKQLGLKFVDVITHKKYKRKHFSVAYDFK